MKACHTPASAHSVLICAPCQLPICISYLPLVPDPRVTDFSCKMKTKEIRPLTTELKLKAQAELGESAERIEQDMAQLKDWVTKIDYIKCRDNDQFLIAFLRGSKYSVEKAKHKLELYYKRKITAPEMFSKGKATNPRIIDILRLGVAVPFPSVESPDAPRIVLVRAGAFNPSEIHISEIFQMAVMMNEIMMLEDDNYVVAGLVNIIDMKGVRATHFAQFTPRTIEKILFVTQEALPSRQRGFHFLNLPLGFNTALTLFKNLFNSRNALRANLFIELHGNDLNKLQEFVEPKYFPTEYGGNDYAIADIIKQWEAKFEKYQDYFTEDEKYGYVGDAADLKKKDEKSDLRGAFRSLSID